MGRADRVTCSSSTKPPAILFLDIRTENLLRNMFSLRYLGTLFVIFFLTSLHIEAKPLRKRTISEVQLMHNVREHKQVGDRQDWLQEKTSVRCFERRWLLAAELLGLNLSGKHRQLDYER
ncbi:unnamed protein product [Pleuronectes platessa]|uniref:Parathyroid hormone n=1 Tax=Pleuronectes platessa TaxID=8262 RepID=A0A9N7YDE8_PLEPL|nr:unnamed protein product [Pleuronectes platessa]